MLISTKTLIKFAKKWQRLSAVSRKRILLPRRTTTKGHFVVYTTDRKRFQIPLGYLSSEIFGELLKIAEEEFGVPNDGPITMPCDSIFLKYALSIIKRCVTKDIEKALLLSWYGGSCHCSSSGYLYMNQGQNQQQQLLVCSC